MKTLPLQRRGIPASRLVLGCMGFGGSDWHDKSPITAEQIRQGEEAIEAALSIGINMFDHADIYKGGKAEQVFGEVLRKRPDLRSQIFIQSKCGILFGDAPGKSSRFDFSRDHILESVDGSLKRLCTDHLDFLLLHRPDALVDPDEVADAFQQLSASGKVRWFGVSNMSTGQIRLLQHSCDVPLIANQLEMSLAKFGFLDVGTHVNQVEARNNVFPEGTLEFCRMENIQLQAWGPLSKGIFSGKSIDDASDAVKATAKLVKELADEKGTSREAIVLAWLIKHPAAIQPIIGTANPARIKACADADKVELTREEWYSLYISTKGRNMP